METDTKGQLGGLECSIRRGSGWLLRVRDGDVGFVEE